jgi:hypothetical protein
MVAISGSPWQNLANLAIFFKTRGHRFSTTLLRSPRDGAVQEKFFPRPLLSRNDRHFLIGCRGLALQWPAFSSSFRHVMLAVG